CSGAHPSPSGTASASRRRRRSSAGWCATSWARSSDSPRRRPSSGSWPPAPDDERSPPEARSLTDRMLQAYVERHRKGALTEKHLADLVNELRRLRDEVKTSRRDLMEIRRSRALVVGELQQ